jgi:DNA-binding CsgD family transcriptional regulator/ArsR family metal-binding transcriptional regulator
MADKGQNMFVKGYSDFSLSKSGILQNSLWGAYFRLDNDVSELFPYINAKIKAAKLFDTPRRIQFNLTGKQFTVYPTEVLAVPFEHRDEAHRYANHLIDFLNQLDLYKESITPDYKRSQPVSVMDIFKLLPKTNCKECGYATCLAFAGALRTNETTPDQCPGFSKPISEKAVYPILDDDGNLLSTVAIEIDTPSNQREPKKQQETIEKLEKRLADVVRQSQLPVESGNDALPTPLTGRELEVLRLLVEGATNTEISDLLNISPHTVKSHVIHIFNKLGVNDRTQAAVYATRHRLV